MNAQTKLSTALWNLLQCSELNTDELEPATIEAIKQANAVLFSIDDIGPPLELPPVDDCPECNRSYGPHYRGRCEH